MRRKKKIYEYGGPGKCLGATVIVVAYSLEEAREYIKKYLDESGLKMNNDAENLAEYEITVGIVYEDNGDY